MHLSDSKQAFDPERARPVVKGDSKCLCIAAASVIAKVTLLGGKRSGCRPRIRSACGQRVAVCWPSQRGASGHLASGAWVVG